MKKSEKSELLTIKKFLDFFDVEMQKAVDATTGQFVNKIVLGYRSFKYKAEKNRVIDFINCLNPIISNYKKLLKLSEVTSDTLNTLFELVKMTEEKIQNELKIRYFKEHKIQVPNFPFKLSVLVEAYEFPADHLELIETIASSIYEDQPILAHAELKNYARYFDGKKFTFSSDDDQDLISKHTVYADAHKLLKTMALHMFCTGLTNLKTPEYSFKNLPEIPAHLMGLIKIDTRLTRETGISVDIDKLNNPDGKMASFGISQSPTGGMSIRVLPRE